MRQILLIFSIALLLGSCEPAATFNQPQPAEAKQLKAFPDILQGKYLDSAQSSTLIISDKIITRVYDFDIEVYGNSGNVSGQITGDTLTNRADRTKHPLKIHGDTAIRHIYETDTLFTISENQVLTAFKGFHFLNIQQEDSTWEVKKIRIKKGILTIAALSKLEDLKKLREITATVDDTVSTYFNLSRKQFREFVRQNGFTGEERFTRIGADATR